jgi:hypothetical protein
MPMTAMTGLSSRVTAAALIISLSLAATGQAQSSEAVDRPTSGSGEQQAQSSDTQGRQAANSKSGAFVNMTPTHKDGSSGLKRRRWKR